MVGIATDIVPTKIMKFTYPGVFTAIGPFIDFIQNTLSEERSLITSAGNSIILLKSYSANTLFFFVMLVFHK